MGPALARIMVGSATTLAIALGAGGWREARRRARACRRAASLSPAWADAVRELERELAQLPGTDRQPQTLSIERAPEGVRIVATARVGRRAERTVRTPVPFELAVLAKRRLKPLRQHPALRVEVCVSVAATRSVISGGARRQQRAHLADERHARLAHRRGGAAPIALAACSIGTFWADVQPIRARERAQLRDVLDIASRSATPLWRSTARDTARASRSGSPTTSTVRRARVIAV